MTGKVFQVKLQCRAVKIIPKEENVWRWDCSLKQIQTRHRENFDYTIPGNTSGSSLGTFSTLLNIKSKENSVYNCSMVVGTFQHWLHVIFQNYQCINWFLRHNKSDKNAWNIQTPECQDLV